MSGDLSRLRRKIPAPDIDSMPEPLKTRINETKLAMFDHSKVVEAFSVEVALEMKFDPETCEIVRQAALLHDVGKVKVPYNVLMKLKGTPAEWEMVKSHVMVGEELDYLRIRPEVVEAIENHHEHWDGTGYPNQKSGNSIPLAARIIAVADVYASAAEPHLKPHEPLSRKTPAEALKALSGTKLDPKIVEAALRVIEREKQ